MSERIEISTCTANGWFVSRSIKYGPNDPKGGVLSVCKYPRFAETGYRQPQNGDGEGRIFQSDAEYMEYCMSHGYLQVFLTPGLGMFKSIHRKAIRQLWRGQWALVEYAKTRGDAYLIARSFANHLIDGLGCDILMAMKFSNGMHTAIRKARPDLFKEPRQ